MRRLRWHPGPLLWLLPAVGLICACQPVLSEGVLRRHEVQPKRDLREIVLEQPGPPPAWLAGGASAGQIVLTGEGEGADRDSAQSLAQAALTQRVHEALGAEVSARYASADSVSAAAPQGASTSQQTTRMRAGALQVLPDATYWQHIRRAGTTQYRAYARRVIPRSELAQGAPHRGGAAGPDVRLELSGPRAPAVALSLFFARQGATRYRLLDPRQPRASPRRTGPPPVVVQGGLQSLEPLVYELRIPGGGVSQVRARDWQELSVHLPLALHRLLVPKGGPRR